MSTHTKRKLSSLSESELDVALTSLRKLRSSIVIREVPESDPTPADTLTGQLDTVIAALESQAHGPLSLSFSAADEEALERFNIVLEGLLFLHPEGELREAIIASRAVGSDKLWSNDTMYKHLSFLVSSCASKNETSSRMAIDTFFFRAASMVPPPQKVIVMLENQVSRPSQMNTTSGIIDYTAIVAEPPLTEVYIRHPPTVKQGSGNEMIAFFAMEAKVSGFTAPLEGYLPRVLLELVACAKHLGKSHIRGALTTGFRWQFVILDLNADGDGAKYWVSDLIEWKWRSQRSASNRGGMRLIEETSDESDPALIAGILSSWIPNSFTKFTGDQWFNKYVVAQGGV